MTYIPLWGTGKIDRMSEVQFVLPRNDGKPLKISSFHISETCGFIFNKLGIQVFSEALFLISKPEKRDFGFLDGALLGFVQ